MYSLVSAAVLAADLVRHPHAVMVLDVLDRTLALTPQETARLADPAPEQVRRRVAALAEHPRRAFEVLGSAAAVPGELATLLEGALLGTLDDLHALVLREDPVRALSPSQQQVVLDALTAAWVGADAPLAEVGAMAQPFAAAVSTLPPVLPERPWSRAVRDLLDEVPRRTASQWAASGRRASTLRWSEAQHRASTAAWGAGRLHDVARAQLAGARALVLTHTGISPYRAARVVTGAVQAVCTADLLDDSVADALRADWEAGSGAR